MKIESVNFSDKGERDRVKGEVKPYHMEHGGIKGGKKEASEPIAIKRIPMDWFTNEPPKERFFVAAYAPRGAVTLLVAAGWRRQEPHGALHGCQSMYRADVCWL